MVKIVWRDEEMLLRVVPRSTSQAISTAIRNRLNLPRQSRLLLVDDEGCDVPIDGMLEHQGVYTLLVKSVPVFHRSEPKVQSDDLLLRELTGKLQQRRAELDQQPGVIRESVGSSMEASLPFELASSRLPPGSFASTASSESFMSARSSTSTLPDMTAAAKPMTPGDSSVAVPVASAASISAPTSHGRTSTMDLSSAVAAATASAMDTALTPVHPDENPEAGQPRELEKREKLLLELLQTERTYVRNLELINKVYRIPLTCEDKSKRPAKITGCLDGNQAQTLFSVLPVLVDTHKILLRKLEARLQGGSFTQQEGEQLDVCDILVEHVPYLRPYIFYTNNYASAVQMVSELQDKNTYGFASYQEECRADPHRGNNQGLVDLLINPIQRIPRYEMLVKELMRLTQKRQADHPSLPRLAVATAKIAELGKSVNEGRRKYEQDMVVYEKQQQLGVALVEPGRVFLKEGAVSKVSRTRPKERNILYLFNNKLLFSKTHVDLFRGTEAVPMVPDSVDYKRLYEVKKRKKSAFGTLLGTMKKMSSAVWPTQYATCIEELLKAASKGVPLKDAQSHGEGWIMVVVSQDEGTPLDVASNPAFRYTFEGAAKPQEEKLEEPGMWAVRYWQLTPDRKLRLYRQHSDNHWRELDFSGRTGFVADKNSTYFGLPNLLVAQVKDERFLFSSGSSSQLKELLIQTLLGSLEDEMLYHVQRQESNQKVEVVHHTMKITVPSNGKPLYFECDSPEELKGWLEAFKAVEAHFKPTI